jgi:hypothetical protein
VLLLVLVGAGIWYSHDLARQEQYTLSLVRPVARLAVARGPIGSEKAAFLADPKVQQALARHGLSLAVRKAGSREIVKVLDPAHDDFGFPSGAPAAAALKARLHVADTFSPFYTPIVIATWRPIAKLLVNSHLAQEQAGGAYYTLDLPALLTLIREKKRWSDLPGNDAYPASRAILIRSTDVRTSNSAAMYLSLASYVENHQSIVANEAEADAVLPFVSHLFLGQGFQGTSSEYTFQDYLALGMGGTPLLVAYEAQMVTFWMEHPQSIKGDMVIMYPQPTVYSLHQIVPCNDTGRRLGDALSHDPELQSLAHDYGFRTGGDIKGPEVWEQHGIHVPATLIDVVDPPAEEWLEHMITGIEHQFP